MATFFTNLPAYARQAALEEINRMLQAKGQSITLTEADLTGAPAEQARTFKEASKEEIDEVIKFLM